MSEKIINFQEGIRRTLEIKVVKKKNTITLRGKRGTLKIHLNPCIENINKSILQLLIETLRHTKKKYKVKSMKEITKEECKKMLLDNLNRISPVVFQKRKEELLKEIQNGVWEDVEKEILSSEVFWYELIIGSINDTKNPFTYAVSDFFIIK